MYQTLPKVTKVTQRHMPYFLNKIYCFNFCQLIPLNPALIYDTLRFTSGKTHSSIKPFIKERIATLEKELCRKHAFSHKLSILDDQSRSYHTNNRLRYHINSYYSLFFVNLSWHSYNACKILSLHHAVWDRRIWNCIRHF